MIDTRSIFIKKKAEIKKPAGIPAFFSRDIRLFKKGMSDRKKERFYNELHVLLTAGVDIRTAFELMESEAEHKEEKELLGTILEKIVAGATMPEAVQATKQFTPYEYFSLRIGEESGRMNAVLKDLNAYFTKKIKQKRKVTSALSYPLIVITVAFLAVGFMLRFVVPMFADMLSRFGTELPEVTKMVIALSDGMGSYGPWILLVLISIGAFAWSQRKQDLFRRISASVVIRIPYAGKITQKIYVERFAHALHLLLASKTNLIDALELVQKMVGFYSIERSLEQVRKDVLGGAALHESLSKFPIYPKRMVSLVRVAEEVNQLDMMFEKLSTQLSDDIEHETSMLASVIEPLMILFLGVMVAVILVAMYLPMFKLGSAFD